MSMEERIAMEKKTILDNWKSESNFLGVKRYKLYRFSSDEKLYIINSAIGQLRREGIIIKRQGYYFAKVNNLEGGLH